MPYIVKVANKELPYLHVYGNDYDTPDGTGVRDYIHVVDLAKGHVNAVNKVMEPIGVDCYNLGTGIGYSVLDVVNTLKTQSLEAEQFRLAESFTLRQMISWRSRQRSISVCSLAMRFV